MKIEKEIRKHLDGDMQEGALEFVAWLNANGMAPQLWFGPGFWRVPYGEIYLCGIHLRGPHSNKWVIWFWSGDYSGEADEALMKFVEDHVGPCVKCGGDCKIQGLDMTIFGKEYTNVCCQFPVRFEDPDKNTLEQIKALIEYWKTAAPNKYSWHYRD